ncbi:type II secretion system secretin GspD [Vulgatibacter incomptus]|uniref:General secretion pathway protein D / Type II secretion outermembrane pore forming protein (PulD) n=1 Tax=Vulgatibacter incomptus TaxID=1391653 RepID=A0A0K1PCS2_9BACT|nr:type II secretion system secretin GspD [Vulgatibacter incomptus]AKU91320.1 General secretion pathway protein D / Type II secretion outermembrane pore forming protein (PulD) [Vulgatibacter incomptus]
MQIFRTYATTATIAALLLAAAPAAAQVPVRPSIGKELDRPGRNRPAIGSPQFQQRAAVQGAAQPPAPAQAAPPPAGSRQPPATQPPRQQQAQQQGQQGQQQAQQAPSKEQLRQASKRSGKFQLDFNKAEIADVVQTISDFTGKLFIVPENIRGKITIVGPEDGTGLVTADEAYAAFLSGLEANNWTVYPVGKYLKLVEKRSAATSNTWTYVEPGSIVPDDERVVTKVIRLHYVDTDAVSNPLKQLMSKDATVIPMPPDTLIVTEVALNLRRIERILAALDQPGGGDELRLIQIEYATAAEISEKLLQIFEAQGGGKPGQGRPAPRPMAATRPMPGSPEAPSAPGSDQGAPSITRVIPDERTNKLIVVANRKAFDQIEGLIRQLDVPTGETGRINVYYLENAKAEDLASTLQGLTSGASTQGPQGRPGMQGRRPGAPAAGQAAQASAAAELLSGEVKVSADKATNSLVIVGSAQDYKNIVKVIEKLDIPRRQVFVEAVIMEVNLRNTNELGFSLHGGATVDTENGIAPIVVGSQLGSASSLNLSSLVSMGGFLAGMQGPPIPAATELGVALPSFGVVMHAMTRNSDVNVLSTPHILTSDNEEAEITVGQNVPFQAGFAPQGISNLFNQTGANGSNAIAGALGSGFGLGSLFAPIQRQNVELKLKIKPQINESNYIRMEVEEQTEEIAEQDPVLGPTTAKRTAKTVVVAQDQTTVVIGGLIQERTIKSVQKTPILGDIPVLGWLFRDTATTKTKTNLLLFLTPYIVRDQSDFRRIFERKMREREEFMAAFYGTSSEYEVPVDFARKAGPVSIVSKQVEQEMQKLENGGPGAPGEAKVAPNKRSNEHPAERSHAQQGEQEAPAQPAPPQGGFDSETDHEAPAAPEVPPENE